MDAKKDLEDYRGAKLKARNTKYKTRSSSLGSWLILSVIVFLWGLPQIKAMLDGLSAPKIPVFWLDKLVVRVPPVVAKESPEAAVFNLNWLSATGTGIFIASIIAGLSMGYSFKRLLQVYWQTIKLVRFSLLTISAMLAIGFTTRYSGLDATLGLAFAKTGCALSVLWSNAWVARRCLDWI